MLNNVAVNVVVNVAVNTKYLSERLGVNRRTIQRDVVALQEKHLIQWVGSDKTGYWEIKDYTERRAGEERAKKNTIKKRKNRALVAKK